MTDDQVLSMRKALFALAALIGLSLSYWSFSILAQRQAEIDAGNWQVSPPPPGASKEGSQSIWGEP